jgi:predicted dinucleotide-binding enzyme
MRIGVLGSGVVGQTIGTKLVQLGHEVTLGSRAADNPKGAGWVKGAGDRANQGTFSDAASFGEIVFNCTSGVASLEALRQAGEANLAGKLLIDLANPLDFSRGMPPTLSVCNTESLGEQIQAAFPKTRVVKSLNTINCQVMVNPSLVPGEHDVFVSGNDAGAKAQVTTILRDWFGWRNVVDLGDIVSSRGVEMYLPLWLRLMGAFKTPHFNVHVAHAQS